jgi:hypothetical protein
MAYQPYALGQYNLNQIILTDKQFSPLQLDANGNLKVVDAGSTSVGPTTTEQLLSELLEQIKITNRLLLSALDGVTDVDDFTEPPISG